jgi:hypothetical protein
VQGQQTTVVVPLNVEDVAVNPWELVAQGKAVTVTLAEASDLGDRKVGTALSATSALGRQLGQILSEVGNASPNAASASNGMLFTLELPNGSVLTDLVPATGGGFRGMTRAAGSSNISGHARLLPAGSGEGAAVAGAVALGPALALMAVAVGGEALARYQLEKKLDANHDAVRDVDRQLFAAKVAKLDSAEQALKQASAAIMDQVSIPASVGLGAAVNGVREVVSEGRGWLTGWEKGAESLTTKRADTGVDLGSMERALGITDDDYSQFARRAELFYRALVLDARAQVLTGAEAAFSHPDSPLTYLRVTLNRSLKENAELQERLREVMWKLSASPIGYSLPAMPNTGKKAARCDRMLRGMAMAFARMPDAPPVLGPNGRQVVEILRKRDGTVHVLEPVAS